MGYYDARFALEIFSKKDSEEKKTEGTKYPALREKGEFVFSHLPEDTETVIIWELGEKDSLGVRDRNVYSVYERTSDGRWMMVY